jgi:hypothetical protein
VKGFGVLRFAQDSSKNMQRLTTTATADSSASLRNDKQKGKQQQRQQQQQQRQQQIPYGMTNKRNEQRQCGLQRR